MIHNHGELQEVVMSIDNLLSLILDRSPQVLPYLLRPEIQASWTLMTMTIACTFFVQRYRAFSATASHISQRFWSTKPGSEVQTSKIDLLFRLFTR